MNNYIDLNCDMGESYGRFQIGNDEAVMPHITSCNIACGWHGGDPLTIERTILLAKNTSVQIGAHPSYPDLLGFGRRSMDMSQAELISLIKYQVAAVLGIANSHGVSLRYVKPHGALYNDASQTEWIAEAIVRAVKSIDPELAIMGLAGSLVGPIARQHGLSFIAEAFADRKYTNRGTLASRTQTNAVLHNPTEVVEQVLDIVLRNEVVTIEGGKLDLRADSICLHGDNPSVMEHLEAINQAFAKHEIQKKPFAV